MTKTDKELAVEVAKAFIEANPQKIVVAPNNVARSTKPLNLGEVNGIIKSVHSTLQNLSEEK
ncbi:hypothetical protein [Lactococcus lactis]|uniref:hypothetical protein n=1 Tax=Lactococcus lactis TaxID=1358 RepID=UPI0024A87C48|nr:hypothetical protein [Lactococcus lactis]